MRGTVIRLTNFTNHHVPQKDEHGRPVGVTSMSYKAKKGTVFVAVLLGFEPKDGSAPLDLEQVMDSMGWKKKEGMKNAYLVMPYEDAPESLQLAISGQDAPKWVVMVPASDAATLEKAIAFLTKLGGNPTTGFAGRDTIDGVMYRIFLV